MARARSAAPSTWAAITDFRPGVHKNLSPSYPPGTAQESGTYRCYALPSGALAPLPITQTDTFTIPEPVDPDTLACEEFRIIGLHTSGPNYWPTNRVYGTDQNNTEIFAAVEYWVGNDQTLAVYRYRRHYSTSPTWDLIWSETVTGTYDPTVRPAGFHFGTGRSHNANPDQSGPTVICWAGAGYAQMFPDDTTPDTDSTHYLPGDKEDPNNIDDFASPDILCMHQGRVVLFPLQVLAFGNDSLYTHNESMYFTSFNDFRTMDPYIVQQFGAQGFWNITVGPESPVGYGCVASLSANELFLLKRKGGAYVCMGDVLGIGPSSPTTRQLPFVKSPGFALNNGTLTPQGYAYPVDNGTVWLWAGGDFATNAAPQLAYNFWRPEPVDMSGDVVAWGYQWTQCDAANNFTLFPNNWMWDTDTNAWWKLTDPDALTIYRWAVDWRYKKAYGAPRGFRGDDSSDPTVIEFDTATPASSFSWQSQPLATSISQSVNVLNMGVVASGAGTVTLTVRTHDDPVGRTRTFQFNTETHPQFQVESCGVRGTHLTFTVESVAGVDNTPAPVIHEIRYELGATVPV